MKIYNDEFEL